MSGLRVLVVDDEPLARERLRTLCRTQADVVEVAECTGGAAAVDLLLRQQIDILFLDVQMPEVDGFAVLGALPAERLPVIVFVTAFDQYALRAFEAGALDYLLKPFDRERFGKALDRARTQLRSRPGQDLDRRLLDLLAGLPAFRAPPRRLAVRDGSKITFLRMAEVEWIEAAGNYVCLHVGKETHLLRQTMAATEAGMDPDLFVRVHRNAIVNVEHLREILPWSNGDQMAVLRDGTRVTVSRGHRRRLEALLR